MDLSRGWYVTTNGTPFSAFVLIENSFTRKFNLFGFSFYEFLRVSCENHHFISQIYFSKSFSSRQIRLSLRAWL